MNNGKNGNNGGCGEWELRYVGRSFVYGQVQGSSFCNQQPASVKVKHQGGGKFQVVIEPHNKKRTPCGAFSTIASPKVANRANRTQSVVKTVCFDYEGSEVVLALPRTQQVLIPYKAE